MKKIVSFAIVILFSVSTIPVFAQSSDKGKCNPFTPFQRIADTMKLNKAKPKNQLIPMSHKPVTLQGFVDDIKKGSEEAKGMSLRTPKAAAPAVTK